MNGLLGDAARGLVRGVTADFAGAPVDTLNAIRSGLLGPAQAGNPYAAALGGLLGPVQQVGSGDWIAQQMGLPQGSGMVYETARMLAPSPTEMLNVARRVPLQELITYHGTPHRFEATPDNPLGEFRASQIGTGEGAQAYGHGVYLAESPEVAEGYKKALQTTQTLVNGKPIGPDDPIYEAAIKISNMGHKKAFEDAVKTAESGFLTPEGKSSQLRLAEQIKSLKGAKIRKEESGSLYTADLPDEMIDRMLDWDKPLSEQPEAVRETVMRYMNVGEKQLPADMRVGQIGDKYVVLQDKPPLPGSTFGVGRSIVKGPRAASEQEAVDAYWNSLTGKDLYDTIAKDFGKNADASDYMRQLGIPGIKYLDAGSRGDKAKPTRNFVIFPGEEKKVKILKRE